MPTNKLWIRAARPFSFTVSILPPILGGIIAALKNPGLNFNWPHFLLALVGCVLAHAGSNLLSDYMDYKSHVDREGTFGSSGVLVEKLMRPEQMLRGALLTFATALLIGIYLIFAIPDSLFLVWLILLGGVFGFFYTVGPIAWKYNALGDIAVFVSFGSAMCLGAYYIQAQQFSWAPVLYILPLALLVDAILHANNLRDIENDKVAGIHTFAILIGDQASRVFYIGLVVGSYVITLILMLFAGLTWLATLTFISMPMAFKLIKVTEKDGVPIKDLITLDAATAQLHSAFGVLFTVALLVDLWIL